MYGLFIFRQDSNEDIIKISSRKEKLNDIAMNEMKQYFSENKQIPKDELFLAWLEAAQMKDIEMAMEIFELIAEKNDDTFSIAIAAAEIVHDA